MVSLAQLQALQQSPAVNQVQYQCRKTLDLHDSPTLERLATQAATGRYLRVETLLPDPETATGAIALSVCLCEDGYSAWLAAADVEQLVIATTPYQPQVFPEAEIQTRISGAIAFAEAAMTVPNTYLWGGTVAPNYDCSGLVQAAFASIGVWLPRDSYQQEAFVRPVELEHLLPGDLVFFGTPLRATHVGIYLGNDRYIHSSGKDQGRNGIGIDTLSGGNDPISQKYHAQFRCAGRVVKAYNPTQGDNVR